MNNVEMTRTGMAAEAAAEAAAGAAGSGAGAAGGGTASTSGGAAASSATSKPDLDPALPFFTNERCPYFPCHRGVDPAAFNCVFCFCPLYALGEACGGRFTYTDEGVKDCSACTLPHEANHGNALVSENFPTLSALAAQPSGRAQVARLG